MTQLSADVEAECVAFALQLNLTPSIAFGLLR
jgi:hypothetical protein